jgi:hypothetical protein
MSLSGCEEEESNRQLKEELQKNFPQLSSSYVVCSDTLGSLAAALENGMYQYQTFPYNYNADSGTPATSAVDRCGALLRRLIKIAVFCNMMPYSWVVSYQCFKTTCHLHF